MRVNTGGPFKLWDVATIVTPYDLCAAFQAKQENGPTYQQQLVYSR